MAIVSGNGQTGTVGHDLPKPLVVLVRDAQDNPVPNQVVNFVITAGGGSVFAGANSTNADGIAQERWTLGTSTADSQVVEVRAVDNVTGEPRTFARFVATALADAPAALSIVRGSAQSGPLGAPLADSAVVRLADRHGNGTPGKVISWTVLAGGGSVAQDSSLTDPSGLAATGWALGTRLDTMHVLQAGWAGLPAVTFTATPMMPGGATLTKLAGDAQTATVGQLLAEALVVRVVLPGGRFAQGVDVTWSTSVGSLAATGTKTDSEGTVGAWWTLGGPAGGQTASATVPGLDPVTFSATGVPSAPAAILIVQGDAQLAFVQSPLSDSVVVRVEDAFGNRTPGVTITWTVLAGGGSVYPGSPDTDGEGQVGAMWVLGPSEGTNRIQVGTGDVSAGVEATGVTGLVVIAGGGGHTCGLTIWAAYCWGYDEFGQLGDCTSGGLRTTPVAVSGGITFAALTTGRHHTCGLTGTGTAYCWGYNRLGQLGDGTTTNRAAPAAVTGGLAFAALTAGHSHTCGLTSTGTAYCWGYNPHGAVGNGTTTDTPVPVTVNGGLTFTALTAQNDFTCGLTSTGAAYCWGANGFGQLGDDTHTDRTAPVAVVGGLTLSALAPGYSHTCGLTEAGTAYCWGNNGEGALGDGGVTYLGSTTPVAVSGGITFTALTAGGYAWGSPIPRALDHTCGLTSTGTGYCWGSNLHGAIGDPTSAERALSPVPISGGLAFTALTAGVFHTCGLTAAGTAYCWGYNASGQLGDGTTSNRSSPVRSWP